MGGSTWHWVVISSKNIWIVRLTQQCDSRLRVKLLVFLFFFHKVHAAIILNHAVLLTNCHSITDHNNMFYTPSFSSDQAVWSAVPVMITHIALHMLARRFPLSAAWGAMSDWCSSHLETHSCCDQSSQPLTPTAEALTVERVCTCCLSNAHKWT